ncbi:hypothetical protein KIPB_008053, partial [Kipferlia bialata]|eukprot:g8053.t1
MGQQPMLVPLAVVCLCVALLSYVECGGLRDGSNPALTNDSIVSPNATYTPTLAKTTPDLSTSAVSFPASPMTTGYDLVCPDCVAGDRFGSASAVCEGWVVMG